MMFPGMGGHSHKWEPTMHADGCHFYLWDYECSICKFKKITYSERSETDFHYWVDRVDCPRCKELLKGSKPVCSVELYDKSGNLISEKTI